uniref:Uncharacterized protein n=1 Tax=Anopheles minimus TaxID=112268 RepID=A0A182WMM3_9DIPT
MSYRSYNVGVTVTRVHQTRLLYAPLEIPMEPLTKLAEYPWSTPSYTASSSSYSTSSSLPSSYRSSRFSTEPSTTSRFGSLSSTSSYRPSFSSGSYRTPRSTSTSTTSATAPSSTVSSFISRYSSLAADKEKERERDKVKEEERRKERELREREREKERDREKERLIETSKKLEAELKESKPAPLKKSSLIAAKYGSSKDVTATDDSSTKGSTSAKLQATKDAALKPKKDNAPPVTFTTRYGRAGVAREQSREPSPATRTSSSTSIATRSRHRDPSPAPTTVTERARSRDPSPAVETKRTGGYALAIASKLSGTKLPQQNAPNEYRRQSSGTAFGPNRARSRDPSPTVRTRTSREPSPMEQRRLQLANKMIATAARSRDPSPAPVQQLKQSVTANKTNSSADQKQRFTSSITIKTGPGVRSRDPSPAEPRKIPTFGNASKVRSRDPSPADTKRTTSSLSGRASRTGNDSGIAKPSTFGSARKTRDPSPSVNSKVRSRDPSPATVTRRSSREPSPAESVREKYGLGGPGAYRPYGRSNSALGAGHRFGANASPVPKSPIADLALSYMTSSEAIAARTSRPSSRLRLNSQSREPSQCSSPLTASQIFSPEPRTVPNDDQQREGSTSSETTATSSSSEESSEETESSVEPEPKIFIEITLVTRGTSPTPPGATPLIRARRADMCKTIEKTIQKQLVPVETADKQVQSDRMDDSTKYLRYGQPSTRSWSPFLDQKYGSSSPTLGYTRYSSTSSRYSRDSPSISRETSVSSSKSDVPEKRELSTLAARVKELSLSKSNSTRSTASRSSTGSPGGKQKTPPKQKSPEKPPPAPSKDSPSPVRSVANKDFRKSALNMGPAPERPRKSSTSSSKSSSSSASTATPVAETNGSTSRIPNVRQQNGTKVMKRSDRSASTSSEDASSNSGSSGTDTDREQSITRTAPNEQEDLSTATDASNANNELLLRAIQLATNFVNNQNRNATSWYDNASTTSMSESLPADPSGKSGWEAGTHYMESIKDDSSNEEDEEDEADERGQEKEGEEDGQKTSSEYQQAMWWRRSGNFEQTATVQESVPSNRSFTYRIRRVESGEKPWWLSDDGNKQESEQEQDTTEPSSTAGQDMMGGGADAATDDGRTTATSIFESQALSPFRPIRVTRIESGERAWWLKSTENVAAKSSGERSKQPSKEQTPDSAGSDKKSPGYTVFKLEAEDEAWWEQAMADISRKDQTSGSSPSSTSSSREPSKEPTPEPRSQGITLTRVVSGEKAWWLYSSEKVNELSQPADNAIDSNDSVRECSPVKAKPFKITRIESGEQPWWMTETSDAPVSRSGSKSNVVSRSNSFNSKTSGKQTSPTKYRITRVESGERAWWMSGDSPDESAGSPRKLSSFVEQHGEEEADLQNADIEAQVQQELESITNFVAGLPKFPTGEYAIEAITSETPPLGDRASPEGEAGGRASPYDNIPSTMSVPPHQATGQSVHVTSVENGTNVSTDAGSFGTRKDTQSPVFISRHTNIDDLLGGSCHPLSPMMDRMFIMDGLQEITPKDVRVHDSTPQFIDYAGQQRQRKASTLRC